MLAHSLQHDPRRVGRDRARAWKLERFRRAFEHDLPAAFSGARSEVQHAVGGQHDLGIVLDHDQRVAGAAQAPHDADHAVHVTRVQPDRRFVKHEQRVDQRGAQRGGQIDPLHLSARQRAALPIQREVTEADFAQKAQPRLNLLQQQLDRLIERRAVVHPLEEFPQPVEWQQRQLLDRVSFEPPQQRVRLQAAAAAGLARRIAAVARQQHPDVHLVRLGLEPFEIAAHAIPLGLPTPAPGRIAVDDPSLLALGQRAPGDVQRDVEAGREFFLVALALLEALGLPRLDRAGAQALARVRYHQAQVDADHATEAAAGRAGAQRRVERERARRRI